MVQKKKFDENATRLYRIGFRDPDLKLQSHDDIVLWLYNNDNIIEDLVRKYIFNEKYRRLPCLIKSVKYDIYVISFPKEELHRVLKDMEEKAYKTIEDRRNSIKKERVILKRAKMVIYNNIESQRHPNLLSLKKEHFKSEKRYCLKDIAKVLEKYFPLLEIKHYTNDFEFLISNKNNYDIGFIDLHRSIWIYICSDMNIFDRYSVFKFNFYFEVKTEYPTLGILIRQLQSYMKYVPYSHDSFNLFFLVGPKHPTMNDFPEFLKQQGWIFVEIPFEINNNNNNKNKKTLLDF